MKQLIRILALIIIFLPNLLFAQETRKVKDKETKEVYYVLKSDNVTRNGEYKKSTSSGKRLVKGFYKNGIKDSIWEFYNLQGEVTQKYNYTTKQLLFDSVLEEEKDKDIKNKIIIGADTIETLLDHPAVYLGRDGLRFYTIVTSLKYPHNALIKNISGKVSVSFIVSEQGNVENYTIKNSIGYGCDEEAIRVLKLLPENWLPGVLNGKNVSTVEEFDIIFGINIR